METESNNQDEKHNTDNINTVKQKTRRHKLKSASGYVRFKLMTSRLLFSKIDMEAFIPHEKGLLA